MSTDPTRKLDYLTPLQRVTFWTTELEFCTESERDEIAECLSDAECDSIRAGHPRSEIERYKVVRP